MLDFLKVVGLGGTQFITALYEAFFDLMAEIFSGLSQDAKYIFSLDTYI